jgi:hypothetical protein
MTIPTDAIRGQVRLVGHRRLSHGLYQPERSDLDEHEEFRRELAAYLLVLPGDAVYTHVTGARLRGWRLPALPDNVPVFAAVRGEQRPRRPGLLVSKLEHPSRTGVAQGLPVDSSEEILLRAARDLGVLDLVIMIDAALAARDLDADRMEEILSSKRPGVVRLRAAWKLSDRRAQSAGETLLRVFHEVMEIGVQPQARIHDDGGRLIGVVDLLLVGTHFVHEYDGAVHRSGKAHTVDLRRERGWSNTPYRRRGYTLDDLLNHALVVMHELDRLLGRPHRLRRIERWRTLADESLYGASGRARVRNRWRRAVGVIEWS